MTRRTLAVGKKNSDRFTSVVEPPIELGQGSHVGLTDGDSGNPSGGAKIVVELDIE